MAMSAACRMGYVSSPWVTSLGGLGGGSGGEEGRPLGVEPQGQQAQRHLVRVESDQLRVVGAREGVVVDDAVDRVVSLLHRDVVAEGAQGVADVRQAGRLDAAEDAAPGRGRDRG